jgi:hypothetical protein
MSVGTPSKGRGRGRAGEDFEKMLGKRTLHWQNNAMIDLFNFLKDFLRNETDVIAAFVMGIIVAAAFLSYVLYWLFSKFYSKKITELEAESKNAKEGLADLRDRLGHAEKEKDDFKKKSKDRKAKIEEHEEEISKLNDHANNAIQAAEDHKRNEEKATRSYQEALKQGGAKDTKFGQLAAKYNKLGAVAMSLKKQVTALNTQAKLFEKLQDQLWDLPVEKEKIAPFRHLKKNSAVIIALTNLKGGVGKTTLTANIAATYCRQMDKRVLVIDLDFQASLTGLCLSADLFDERKIGVDDVFQEPIRRFRETRIQQHGPNARAQNARAIAERKPSERGGTIQGELAHESRRFGPPLRPSLGPA